MSIRPPDALEARWLLAAPEVVGNVGRVVLSQFRPYGTTSAAGVMLRGVRLGGPLRIGLDAPGASDAGPSAVAPIVNSGLVRRAQVNGAGFRTVGLQFRQVRIGGGLAVRGSDNEAAGMPPTTPVLPTLPNRGIITRSQFNDGGFGTLETRADGSLSPRAGRVGFQWRKVRVGGPVDVALEDDIVQPGATAATPLPSPSPVVATAPAPGVVTARDVLAGGSDPGRTVIDLATNSGRIRSSQFNDGGFGDLGFQWSAVRVGGRVGTTTNTLFLKPRRDNNGPITIQDRVFGQDRPAVRAASASGSPVAPSSDAATRAASVAQAAFRTTFTNSATNSGRVVRSQFNDGGFGDVGLQWKAVRVGGGVTVAHNALTVQPQNRGQARITVRNVSFPVAPAPGPRPTPGPERLLPPDPEIVANDGEVAASDLPPPTGPISPFFPTPFAGSGTRTLPFPGNFPLVNAATNSGLVRSSQFNAGGFGDMGLQWQNVGVGGKVRLVHNSLSVQPQGSKLEGIAVENVSYGPKLSRREARHLAVLPFAVISTGSEAAATAARRVGGAGLVPPNDRLRVNPQIAAASGTDVVLQWNGIEHRRGLVVVHNSIKILGVGPETGPITLRNIRFPYRVPALAPLGANATTTATSAGRAKAPARAGRGREAQLLNSANNSGIVDHAQFSDGGFGDDGLQWRRVRVDGSVEVVHNTLSVNASADLPPGDVSGPITISGVTFNSGALRGDLSRGRNQIVVSPPDRVSRVTTRPPGPGRPLPSGPGVRDDGTNSGALAGGQLSAGGANHALLQWQCVRVRGKVRVIDNVLAIRVLDRPSGPITISDVTFA